MFKCSFQLLHDTPFSSVFVCSLVISIHNCADFSGVLLLLKLQLALSCLSLPGRCLTPFVTCGAYPSTYFWALQAGLPVKVCRVQRDEDGECLGCLATRCLCWRVLLQHGRLHGLHIKHESLFKLCSAHLLTPLTFLQAPCFSLVSESFHVEFLVPSANKAPWVIFFSALLCRCKL